MQWLKQITVDLLATLVIALVVFFDSGYLEYVVYVYTVLLAIARSLTLFSGNFRVITEKKVSEAPEWIYHLLYALNTLFLAYGEFYITASGWLFIWIIAFYVHRSSKN